MILQPLRGAATGERAHVGRVRAERPAVYGHWQRLEAPPQDDLLRDRRLRRTATPCLTPIAVASSVVYKTPKHARCSRSRCSRCRCPLVAHLKAHSLSAGLGQRARLAEAREAARRHGGQLPGQHSHVGAGRVILAPRAPWRRPHLQSSNAHRLLEVHLQGAAANENSPHLLVPIGPCKWLLQREWLPPGLNAAAEGHAQSGRHPGWDKLLVRRAPLAHDHRSGPAR